MVNSKPEWISPSQPPLEGRQGPLFAALCLIVLALALYATSGAGYFATQNYSDFLQHGYYTGIGEEEEGNSLSVIGTITSVILIISLILSPPRRFNKFAVAFLSFQIWFAITVIWSSNIGPSLISMAKTIIYVLAIYGLMRWMTYRDVIKTLTFTVIIICFISIYLCLTDPIFRISLGADGWRGLFPQKNVLAAFCLFSILLIYPALFQKETRILSIISVPLLIACVILSKGKTALLLSVLYIIIATPIFFYIGSGRRLERNLYFVSIIMAFTLIIVAIITAIAIYGGWIDFTGRVPIWGRAISSLGDHFVFGVGGMATGAAEGITKNTNAEGALVFDSSYVIILYNQGLIGIIWYLAVVVFFWANIVKTKTRYAVFSILTLVCYIVYAFFESTARLNLSYPGIILMIQCFLTEKLARKEQAEITTENSQTLHV